MAALFLFSAFVFTRAIIRYDRGNIIHSMNNA